MAKTVLETVNISNKVVSNWKRRGLKITYPMRQNLDYLKSADGEIFIETADKFVPKLTRKEITLYTRNPKRFRSDFLRNVRLYKKFCVFIVQIQKRADVLRGEDKMVALLSLIYLFQRAMDHHYYHWDRYLAYENYQETPVGYWWKKLEDLYIKSTKAEIKKQDRTEGFLKLVSLDKATLKAVRENLPDSDSSNVDRALNAIKVFEDAQQKEAQIITNYTKRNDILFSTGLPLWDAIQREVKKGKYVKPRAKSRMDAIMQLHPVIGARRLLLAQNLECFNENIFSGFMLEIKRWIK